MTKITEERAELVLVEPGHWRRARRSGAAWARMCRLILSACFTPAKHRSHEGGRLDEIARAIVRGGWDQAPDTWRINRAREYLSRRRRRGHGWPG